MSIYFSKEELIELEAMIDVAYGLSISNIELTYGENLEKILFDKYYKQHIDSDVISNYIYQLKLQKQFYCTFGFDDITVIDKVILILEEMVEEKKHQDHC